MTNRLPAQVEEAPAPATADEPVALVPAPGAAPRAESAWSRWWPRLLEAAALAAIVAMALWLRFRGIEWGTGYYLLHPDEFFITQVMTNISAPSGFREYLDSANSPLNPFNHGTGFIYGTFPLFVAKFVHSFTNYTDQSYAMVPGRWVSAVADTGTVVLCWWIGRMLWSRWTGLLAALLMAFTALNIGASHYFTTDTASTFFATASFAFVVAAMRYRRWAFYALAGAMVGLAAASKPTMLAALGFLALPLLDTIRLQGWQAIRPNRSWLGGDDEGEHAFPVLLASALALFVMVWTVRLAQPYTFQGPSLFSFQFDPRWLADVEYWRNVQSGLFDYPPSIQWSERAPIVFQLDNLIRWGMGPGLALAALGGLGWQVWTLVVARRWPSWIILGMVGWIGFHLVYFGIGLSKAQRYLMPAYPFLVLLAAAALVAMVQWGRRHGRVSVPWTGWTLRFPRWLHPGFILPVLAVGSTMFYGAAFISVYTEPHTRVAASEWIVANLPDGTSITNESWDLPLPVGVPSLVNRTYDLVQLHPYADETPPKLSQLIGSLQRSEYIVLSSARISETVTRMPSRYPMATRFYEALYSGELGFDQVAHFTSHPQLFGIAFDDRSAEESLTVYDHPEVTIFQKTDRWNAHNAWYLLDDALGHGGLSQRPAQTQPEAMMLDPAGREDLASLPAWSATFDPGSIANRLPVIAWYLAFQVLVIPFVPILWRICPWLPDRGYAAAKTIGVFAIGWAAWWLASVGWLDFGLVGISLGWLTAFAASLLILRTRAGQFLNDLRTQRRWIVATEALLLGGYLLATWARSHHPDLWVPGRIGSQLQNMATFNAMARTPSFPAYDPWLADGTIHDFTFGFVPWAVLTRLTGIVPEAGYSLALATLAALVIVNAWMGSALLIARFRPASSAWIPIAGGLAAPGLLLGIGSWGMAQRVGAGDWEPNFEGTALDAVRGFWTTLTSSPVVPPEAWHTTDTFIGPGVLEFPLLSFLTGELAIQHLAMPLAPLLLGLLAGYLTRPRPTIPLQTGVLAALGQGRATAFLALSGLVLGWALAGNPPLGLALAGLTGLAIFLTTGSALAWHGAWRIVRDTALAIGTIGVVAGAAVYPFLASYGTLATERAPLVQHISVAEYLGHMGAALAIVIAYLLWQTLVLAGSIWRMDGIGVAGLAGGALVLVAALGLAVAIGHLGLFLLLLGGLVGLLVWFYHDDTRHLVLLGGITLVFVCGGVGNRMTFLTWTQQQNLPLQLSVLGWTLLAIVAASILVTSLAGAWDHASGIRMATRRIAAVGWVVIVAVLVGAGSAYPVLGYPERLHDRLVQTAPTIDSWAFMDEGQLGLTAANLPTDPYDLAGDLAAIEWMRENLAGMPTIIEAPTMVNGWGGRVSALTGYPTVVGPMPVQKQQRPGMERLVDWRYADVDEVYRSEEAFAVIEPILQDYGVRVIYVGALERATYPAPALARFDEAVAAGELTEIYDADGVTLYFYSGARDSREPFPTAEDQGAVG